MTSKPKRIISDKWILLSVLGNGANSTVHEVESVDGNLNNVALKVIKHDVAKGSNVYQRLKDEIAIQQELTENGCGAVLPLLDYNLPDDPEQDDPIWLAMPKAETAKKKLRNYSKLEEVVQAIRDTANALCACINAKDGFLHRDIKPENIFFYDERWCLGDFGLVQFDGKENITESGDRIGSMYYIAPELMNNEKFIDEQKFGEKSEVYALAKSLFVLAVGNKYPIPGSHHMDDSNTLVSTWNKHPKAAQIDSLIVRATRSNPTERISLDEFISELTLFLNDKGKVEMPEFTKLQKVKMLLAAKKEPALVEAGMRQRMDEYLQKTREYIRIELEPIATEIGNDAYFDGPDLIVCTYLEQSRLQLPGPPFGDKSCLCVVVPSGTLVEGRKYIHGGIGLIPLPNDEIFLIGGIIFSHNNFVDAIWMEDHKVSINSAKEEDVLRNLIVDLKNHLDDALLKYAEWA
ncbi:MAG TPA: protein kinase domain-containing protein [Candidatus Wunengus sp. YC63]|uniref:protein kinase domain-containing protein n=1 Tax=Candidatus Wunengus sp. YC63 TaxID=3367699 RepID=UPI004027332E